MSSDINRLKDEIDNAVEEVEHSIRNIESKEEWFEQVPSPSEREDIEVDALEESFKDLISDLDADEFDHNEAIDFVERLQQIYEDPFYDALEQDISDLYDILGVEVPEDLRESIQSRFEQEPESAQAQYQEILNELSDSEDIVREVLSEKYNRNPQLLLNNQEIRKDIQIKSQQYDRYSDVSDKLEEKSWSPSDIKEIIIGSSRLKNPSPNWDKILETIEQIDDFQSEFDDLNITFDAALAQELDQRLTQKDEKLDEIISDIANSTGDIVAYKDDLLKIETLLDELDVTEETSSAAYYERLTKISHIYSDTADKQHSSLDEFEEDIRRLQTEFQNWQEEITRRWNQIQKLARYYIEELGDDIGISATEPVETAIDEGIDPGETPDSALSRLELTKKWLTEQESELEDEMDSKSVSLVNDLVTQDSVPVDHYSGKVIENVGQVLDLAIIIDEE